MKLKYYSDLIRGKTKAKNPAKLTLRNIWAVIQATFRKKTRKLSGFCVPDHVFEQIIWRRLQVIEKSPECWKSGNCIQCGCEIIGKTMEDRACENEPFCYPEMMKFEIWEGYKKQLGIKIFD